MNYKIFKQEVKKNKNRSLYEYTLFLAKNNPGKHFREINTEKNREAYLKNGYNWNKS